jgi:hypothetical protein
MSSTKRALALARQRPPWLKLAVKLTAAWLAFEVLAGGFLASFAYWLYNRVIGGLDAPDVIQPHEILVITAAVLFARGPDLLLEPPQGDDSLFLGRRYLLAPMVVLGVMSAFWGAQIHSDEALEPHGPYLWALAVPVAIMGCLLCVLAIMRRAIGELSYEKEYTKAVKALGGLLDRIDEPPLSEIDDQYDREVIAQARAIVRNAPPEKI